jgi:hypothetical protein
MPRVKTLGVFLGLGPRLEPRRNSSKRDVGLSVSRFTYRREITT